MDKKKRIMVFIVADILLLVSVIISGCANAKQFQEERESLLQQIESLSQEKESLYATNEEINKKYSQVSQELESINESFEAAKKETELQEEDIVVRVVEKGELPKDIYNGRYNDMCTMTFEITNNTDQDVQGIEGTLKIMDLFGKEIMVSGCDFTGQTIPAKQTITDNGLIFEINQFISEHMKFYNTAFKDLKFDYTVSQVVFTDGTIKE